MTSLRALPLLILMLALTLALGSCAASSAAAPKIVAENDTCPAAGCTLSDDGGPPQQVAEAAGPEQQDAVAERWGYDPAELPTLMNDQLLVFVAAEVADDCEITLRTLDHQQTMVVLSFERTQESDVCLDVSSPSSAVVMLSGERPSGIRSGEGIEFRFIP